MTTAFPASIYGTRIVRLPDPARIIVDTDWEVNGEWTVDVPGTQTNWAVTGIIDVGGDNGITGELRLRTSAGYVTDSVTVTVPTQQVQIPWTTINNTRTRVFLEVRRTGGSGGLRIIRGHTTAMSAAPGYTPPTTGGGGGGGGGTTTPTVTRPTVRGGYAALTSATSFTISPNDISPAPQVGDKILLLGAARGPSETATWNWSFPGQILFTGTPPSGFRPRIIGSVVDYTNTAATWTVSASGTFRVAAIAIADAVALSAGTPAFGTTPVDPGGLPSVDTSMGLQYTALNFTNGGVTAPPAGHTTVLQPPVDIRQQYVASLDTEAGTYDPGAATVAPNPEQGSAVAITVSPTVTTGGGGGSVVIPGPASGSTVTINTGDNAAAVVAANPADTNFQLVNGTYNNWSDVRPKAGQQFVGPNTGTAVLEGSGKGYCFRAASPDADSVVIGPNILIQNYGNGTSRGDYGAIQASDTDTLNGQYTYSTANNWFVHGVELAKNSSIGIRMGDNMTIYDCEIWGHAVNGITGNRNVGGLIDTVLFGANGVNPATGAYSNGAQIKIVWHNASEGRTTVVPSAYVRSAAEFVMRNCTMNATRTGVTGTSRVGFWADLDCRIINVNTTTISDHPNIAMFAEGCNNVQFTSNTINNTDGYGVALGDDFIGGAIVFGESTNCTATDNTVNNSTRALVNRMSNRSVDWYNSNDGSYVNYAWPTGARYWLTAGNPTPIPGVNDRSNMWTGNNTFQNNVINNCDQVIINEGTNNGGMTTQGSTPIETIRFIGNDYSGSGGITFYERNNSGLTLAQWQAMPYDRDQ